VTETNLERAKKAEADLAAARKKADAFLQSEHDLSEAYIRLRQMIPGALDTTYAPHGVWTHTENKLREMNTDLAAAREEIKRLNMATYAPTCLDCDKRLRLRCDLHDPEIARLRECVDSSSRVAAALQR
jgi:hypothetical protein